MATATHVVKSGETLGHIAKRHGLSVAALVKLNPQIANPDIIRVGDRIKIRASGTKPPAPKVKAGRHVVKRGDTLSKIAASFGVTVDRLMSANPKIKDPNLIKVGQTITIPARKPPPPTDKDPKDATRDWTKVSGDARRLHVMRLLVDRYGYPVNGAAGIVGNLWAESGCLPSRLEGSAGATPLRAKDFAGTVRDFTPREVMERDREANRGPRLPGIGLAQWTAPARRAGLFRHTFEGRRLGASIVLDMDAQVDYLVTELRGGFKGVNRILSKSAVTVNDAADEVVYSFEIPASVLGPKTASGRKKLPRDHPQVQGVFKERRGFARQALKNADLTAAGDPGPGTKSAAAPKPNARTHVVKRGDTLGKIAATFGVTVDRLMAANPQIKDRDVIAVGQVITIPAKKATTGGAKPKPASSKKANASAQATGKGGKSAVKPPVEQYVVRQGDTLGRIGAAFGVSVDRLMAANPQIKDRDRIRPGQVITIPGKRSVLGITDPGSRPGEPKWFTLAMRELGTREVAGAKHNRRILEYHSTAGGHSSDEVPWCSSFVNWCVIQAGLKGTNNAMARSWLRWGQALSTPKLGCVTVLRRGKGSTFGHVGFFLESSGGSIRLLGGNQSNSVSKKAYKKADLLGYRWPKG